MNFVKVRKVMFKNVNFTQFVSLPMAQIQFIEYNLEDKGTSLSVLSHVSCD